MQDTFMHSILIWLSLLATERKRLMSQQHAQFEEEFRDGPQPHISYHDNYIDQPSASYPTPAPPVQGYPSQTQTHVPLQAPMLLTPVQPIKQTGSGIGARVFLAIVSMLFVFGMFVVALAMSTVRVVGSVFALAVIFAFVFALIVFLINLVVNLVSLKR
jgi:hypothetical protein